MYILVDYFILWVYITNADLRKGNIMKTPNIIVTEYRPKFYATGGFAVVYSEMGHVSKERCYNVEILSDGTIIDVFAVGLRKVSVANRPIGDFCADQVKSLIADNTKPFYTNFKTGERVYTG